MKVNPNYKFLQENYKSTRIILLQGGTRSGKTYSVLHFLIWLCYKYPNSGMIITIARKTLPALKGSAYRDFIQLLIEYELYSEGHHHKSELIYSLFGNIIEFISIDQPQKIRGRKRHILFVNEANEITIEDWRQLLFRTTGLIIGDYNPSMPQSFIYDDVIPRTDCKLLISTYKDNPYLTSAQIQEIERLKDIDIEYYKVFGEGQRGNIFKGIIFKDWHTYKEEPKGHIVYGLDFGFSRDELALTQVIINDNGFYIKELLYSTGVTIPELTKFIKSKGILFKPIYCDHEPLIIEELFRAGINAQKAQKGRINEGLELMKSKPIYIHEDSLNLQKEFKSYVWQTDRNGNDLPEPVDYLNDAIDSARYAITSHLQVPNVNATSFGHKVNKIKRATKLQ